MTDATQPNIIQQFDSFYKMYQALIAVLDSLPINDLDKNHIRQDFVNGFLWVKEAMQAIMMQQQQNLQSQSSKDAPLPYNGATEDVPTVSNVESVVIADRATGDEPEAVSA